jgi:predicted amidophosphoribosyltransferase
MSQYLMEVLASGRCPKCDKKSKTIDQQYSFGVYAGVMCRECAISGFRDGCGHCQPQGTRAEYEDMAGAGSYDGDGDWF